MTKRNPEITIALPVYNGETYLAQAIDSLLGQSFGDVELILADNASTDGTEAICRATAARDPRVRHDRAERNLGAAWNFNRTVGMARGRYFKWAAHDDLCAPTFLAACRDALERRPEAVPAHPRALDIDAEGRPLGLRDPDLGADAADPARRFHRLACYNHSCLAVFGLIRAEVLRRTPLIGTYWGSDRILLAELALWGPFVEVPEPLFLHREHPGRSTRAAAGRAARAAWFDPRHGGGRTYPHWRTGVEYLRAIGRSPLGWRDRLRCSVEMARWVRWYWRDLTEDLHAR